MKLQPVFCALFSLSLSAFVHGAEDPGATALSLGMGFSVPLLPIGDDGKSVERAALADAMETFRSRENIDDFSAWSTWLAAHDESVWTPSVRLNYALALAARGHTIRCATELRTTWQALREDTTANGVQISNEALLHLCETLLSMGMPDAELDGLIAAADARHLSDSHMIRLERLHSRILSLTSNPSSTAHCGLIALGKVLGEQGLSLGPNVFATEQATANGISLARLQTLAAESGSDLRAATRSPNGRIPLPCVMHTHAGHYLALINSNAQGLIRCYDPATGGHRIITTQAIEEESSSWFLVPATNLPASWQFATPEESAQIFGASLGRKEIEDDETDDCAKEKPESCGNSGMAGYAFQSLVAGLKITDTPLSYSPAIGPDVAATLAWVQRDGSSSFYGSSISGFGPRWYAPFLSFLTDDISVTDEDVTIYQPGGGKIVFADGGGSYTNSKRRNVVLVPTGPNSYELRYGDGSKLVYAQNGPYYYGTRSIYLSQVVDPV